MENTCVFCGKVFEWPYKKVYCSDKCRHDHTLVRRTRICKTCGKEFIDKRKDALYCSQKCYGYSCRGRANTHSTKCGMCGKEFYIFPCHHKRLESGRMKRMFCSKGCSEQWHELRSDSFKKVCVRCGKKFTPRSENQKCCSRDCAYANNRVELTCDCCGKKFVRTKYLLTAKQSVNGKVRQWHYCSKDCRFKGSKLMWAELRKGKGR